MTTCGGVTDGGGVNDKDGWSGLMGSKRAAPVGTALFVDRGGPVVRAGFGLVSLRF
jgi:hypothetical protein